MDFSQGAGQSSGSDTIPNGQLAWAIINVRGVKASNSGGAYIDIELTLDEGQPYARRKIWEMIGDPENSGNSDAYRQMGQVAIARILEAGKGAGPNNPAGYRLNHYQELTGLRVPIKIKVEKGRDGYDDKNKVAEWLTPNPTSSGFKCYELVTSGVFNVSTKPAAKPAASGFGAAPQQSQPAQTGGFGGAAPQQQGFSQGQPQANQWGGANAGTSQSQATQSAGTATSHSDDGQPNWLKQANGQ